jgi:hypothetical protein
MKDGIERTVIRSPRDYSSIRCNIDNIEFGLVGAAEKVRNEMGGVMTICSENKLRNNELRLMQRENARAQLLVM